MKPANVFQIETASALARPGVLFVRLGLPLLLGAPLALAAMPAAVKASGLAMLIVFVSLFGAAVGHARRRSEGLLARLRLLPTPAVLVSGDLLLAGVVVRLAQTALPLGLFIGVSGPSATVGGVLAAAGLWVVTIVLLTGGGMLLAAAARGNPEVHLAAALAVGTVALFSGLFPVPAPLAGVVAAAGGWNPIWRFHQSLVALAGGGAVYSAPWTAAALAAAAAVAAAAAIRTLGPTTRSTARWT